METDKRAALDHASEVMAAAESDARDRGLLDSMKRLCYWTEILIVDLESESEEDESPAREALDEARSVIAITEANLSPTPRERVLLDALTAIKTQADITAKTFPNAPGHGDWLQVSAIAESAIAKH